MEKTQAGSREGLINPSFRRMPESMCLIFLDPGMRRDDEKRVNQKFPRRYPRNSERAQDDRAVKWRAVDGKLLLDPGKKAVYSSYTRVLDYHEHALGEGTDAEAIAYVLLDIDGQSFAGAAIDQDSVSASLKSLTSALNLYQIAQDRVMNLGMAG